MGTYFEWVNHTKREVLDLHSLNKGGNKIAALAHPRCAAAVAILFAANTFCGEGVADEYFGRWVGDKVEVMPDYTIHSRFGFHSDEIIGFGTHGDKAYTDIGPALRGALEHLGAEFWVKVMKEFDTGEH